MTYYTEYRLKRAAKFAAVIAAAVTIGVLLGHLVSNYEMRFMLSRKYHGTYKGIEVYSSGTLDEQNFRSHAEMLGKAPDKLTECCDRMYFTGSDLDLPGNDAGLGAALGLTQNRTVYISTQSYSSYVVFHELFHAYDNTHGNPLSSSEEFMKLYAANRRVIPVFAADSAAYSAEFFAQAGALYLLMPDELEIAAPDLFKYYDVTLGFGDRTGQTEDEH